jgi:hypothetical protein
MMKKQKVFGIGFHKTGTTSLGLALQQLGYDVTGPNNVHKPNVADIMDEMVLDLVKKHDAFQDNPWPLYYKMLDKKYPGSKFILTTRPTDKWLDSVVKHFGKKTTPMREWIYGEKCGSPWNNEHVYIERYKKHNAEVLEYFKQRPSDLLVLRITEGGSWVDLCNFLDEPVPDIPFPHANKAITRERQNNTLKRVHDYIMRKLFAE